MVTMIPKVYVQLVGSAWPPAQGEYPAGYGQVVDYSSDRELASPILAGQFAGSGFSIGDATISIAQSVGKRMAPWGKTTRKVTKGMKAHIYTATSPTGTIINDLGYWIVDSVSGSLINGAVQLGIVEPSKAGKIPNLLPAHVETPGFAPTIDAAWAVDSLARQMGYFSTPLPAPQQILSAPLQGGTLADHPQRQAFGVYPTVYDRALGAITPTGALDIAWDPGTALSAPVTPLTFFFNFSGTVRIQIDTVSSLLQFEVRPAGVLAVRATSAGAFVTGTFVPNLDAGYPNGVEVQLELLTGGTTGCRVRARSSGGAAWGSWVTDSTALALVPNWAEFRIVTASNSRINGLQAFTGTHPTLWNAPTASIDLLGSSLRSIYLPSATTAWDGIQEITQTLGATATLITGGTVLKVNGYEHMRGADPTIETIDVGTSVEDLPWVYDSSSLVDRLELSYTSGVGRFEGEIFSASEVYTLPPRKTTKITVDLTGAAYGIYGIILPATYFLPGWDVTYPETKYSRWSANPSLDGTGTQPANGDVTPAVTLVSAGRVIVSLTNNTNTTLYTVDGNGNPYLKLRAQKYAPQDSITTIARGVANLAATNSLTVDMGRWVQDLDTANAWADKFWDVVSQSAYSLSRVNVDPKPSRQLGDIVYLSHAGSDLDTKAIITGIHDTYGSDYGQELDLVRLPVSVYDWNTFLAAKTVGQVNTAFAALTNLGAYNDEPLTAIRSV